MTPPDLQAHLDWLYFSSQQRIEPPADGAPTLPSDSRQAHRTLRLVALVALALVAILLALAQALTQSGFAPIQAPGRHFAHTPDGALIVPVTPGDRPGLRTYPVHVPYLQNPGPRDGRADFLLVHGMDHDGDVWWPLARRILARHPDRVHRVYMIDLPAHGSSGWPADRNFGQVGLEDYVDALRTTVATIHRQDASSPGDLILAGHSMGGMVVQMLQARLLIEGGSLHRTFGIDRIMLFAATMPDNLPFRTLTNLPVIARLAHMIGYSRESSLVIEEPDDAHWTNVFFSRNSDGKPYGSDTRPGDTHFMNNAEPGKAGLELMGFSWSLKRPSIPAGAFSTRPCADTGRPCYSLVSVGFHEDQYVRPEEVETLHRYLSGSSQPCNGVGSAAGACLIAHGPHDGVWSALENSSEAALLDRAIDEALSTVDAGMELTGKSS